MTFLLALTSAHPRDSWRKPRHSCDDVSLRDMMTSFTNDLDGNNNGVLWEVDDLENILNVLDRDQDGCVSRSEWVSKVKWDKSGTF